ncbi:cytochrome P450 1A1-like [Mercenaria mercenaria]|uniref:cytochrome P450 1A1-like n=1 Tax=Mercenaria mercenaria TaxID=6596 RepID=UPI00234E9F83|nr:cytochrome P450 1A1-like [Mercenaria mercenaria]
MLNADIFVIVLITILTLFLLAKWINVFSKKRYPPGPWGFPILGHVPLLGDKPEKTHLQWWQQYGDVVRVRLGSWNAIIVNGYEAIKDALERKDDVFSGRPSFVSVKATEEAFDGVAITNQTDFSPKYLQLRKLLVTSLRKYIYKCTYSPEDVCREETEKLTEKLLRYPNDEPVSIISEVELAVESMIYQMIYGKGKENEVEAHVKEIVEATKVINRFFGMGNIIDVVPWLRYIMKGTIERLKKAILLTDWIRKAKIEEHINSSENGRMEDLLDTVLALSKDLPEHENGNSVSRETLLTQLVVVQGAGFDPVSRIILFIILYLAAYPDVQERVQKEVDDVLGNNKAVSWKDRDKLPYLYATIHEIMRITCIVPTTIPHYALHDTILRGYDVDEGTVVVLNLHSVANEKSFWGDPEVFRPERLLDKNGKLDRERCSHVMIFGAGRRICAGELMAKMNIFIVTTTLMQRCSFKKAPGCDLDLEPIRSLVYSPKPFKVTVHGRY